LSLIKHKQSRKWQISRNLYQLFVLLFVMFTSQLSAQAPVNDNCNSPMEIVFPDEGYGMGTFYGDTVQITNATQQFNEFLYFPLFRKTVWYRFRLTTHRKLVVSVWEHLTGTGGLAATDVAFTLFRAGQCLPTDAERASQISPINILGSTSDNPCMPPGEYLLQVGVKQGTATGFIYPRIEIDRPSTINSNDFYENASHLGTLNSVFSTTLTWNCLSMNEKSEVCPQLGDDSLTFTKSAWYTFTTDNSVDILQFQLTNTQAYALRFFEGDIRTEPYAALRVIRDCQRYNNYEYVNLSCDELKPLTTYSVQLISHYDNNSTSNIYIRHMGEGTTQGAVPVSNSFPASNKFGSISPGNSYQLNDYFSCQASMNRDSVSCGTVNPDSGLVISGKRYSLTTWFEFTLTEAAHIYFNASVFSASICNWEYLTHGMVMRLFSKGIGPSCGSIDAVNDLYRQDIFNTDGKIFISCLPAGTYSIQLLAKDPYALNDWLSCSNNQLGTRVRMGISVELVGNGDFSLVTAADVDQINGGAPLQLNGTYNAVPTPFSCVKTVLPDTVLCNPVADRAIFREFTIGDANNDGQPDSGMLSITSANYRTDALNRLSISLLYAGSADALAAAQNKYTWPEKIDGLDPLAGCAFYNSAPYGYPGWDQIYTTQKYCLVPGKYSFLTFGDSTEIGLSTKPIFNWQQPKTKFSSPEKAEDLGDVIALGMTAISTRDTFSCLENPSVIAGLSPCNNSTKLIYREFYLSREAAITITNHYSNFSSFRLFAGRAKDGIAALSLAPYAGNSCYGSSFTSPGCTFLPAGWYTIVSYGQGAGYDNNFSHLNAIGHGGVISGGWSIGQASLISVAADTSISPGPFYNRPYKACVANNGLPLDFENNGTQAIPARTGTYTLCTENFRPANDLPFTDHPVDGCPFTERVAYYVFELTEASFLRISGISNFQRKLYKMDVRTDSLLFPGAAALIQCESVGNDLQVCQLDPGTYTLCVFAGPNQNCVSVTPVITIDELGRSRFDFAKNAYDFGEIPSDGVYHGGKTGDSHPNFPAELNASADIFYCSTGASASDPTSDCSSSFYTHYAPIYPDVPNNAYYNENGIQPGANRRNLWYTFVVEGPGTVQVKVNNLTGQYNASRNSLLPFQVFQSDVDANIPFGDLYAMGELDSTNSAGLTFVVNNHPRTIYGQCGNLYPTVTVDRLNLICASEIVKTRYYILVDLNEAAQRPTLSIDVEVRFMPIPNVSQGAPYDFISGANRIGLNETEPPYTPFSLEYDTEYLGAWGNLTCATVDAADQSYNLGYTCPNGNKKSIWYKFTIDEPGQVLTNFNTLAGAAGAQIYYQLVKRRQPTDSVLTDISGPSGALTLPYLSPAAPYNGWRQYCLVPGEYYLWFNSCYAGDTNQIQPRILFRNNPGDYCMSAVSGSSATTGVYNLKAPVNCQTIGTDFAEDGSNADCIKAPEGMRSSWFVFSYAGPDTVNFKVNMITSGLSNYGSPENIRMRQYYGLTCSSLISTYCWNDFFTINEIPCIPPTIEGNLYLQVVYPEVAVGEIGVRIEIIPNPTPGCEPFDPVAIDVDFDFAKSCTSDSIFFTNYSSTGPNIVYEWDFGIPGAVSTELSPVYEYPPTAAGVVEYPVRLIAHNLEAGVRDTIVKKVSIGAGGNPFELVNDTAVCTNQTIALEVNLLNAFCFWSTGETTSQILVSTPGEYRVLVNYNGCDYHDTVQVHAVPLINGLGNDTVICSRTTITLAPPLNPEPPAFLWSTGSTETSIIAGAAGTYWLQLSLDGCSIADTIEVEVLSLQVDLGNDTVLCTGDTIFLDPLVSGGVLTWSEGTVSTLPLLITEPGSYWLRTDSLGCSYSDLLQVDSLRINLHLPDSLILCYNSDVRIEATTAYPGVSWLWNNGGTAPDTTVFDPGIYRVESRIASCYETDSVVVHLQDDRFSLGNDTNICLNNSLLLAPALQPGTAYSWSDQSTASNLEITGAGTFWLAIERNGCLASDTIVVTVTDLSFGLGADTLLCELQSFVLSPLVPPGVRFIWSDQSTAPEYTVTGAGLVSLTIDSAGCTWYDEREIIKDPLPVALIGALPNPVCLGDCINIEEVGLYAESWKWNIADSLVFNNKSFVQCANEYGEYSVILETTNHCGADTAEAEFAVYKPDIRVMNDTVMFAGDTLLVWAEGAFSYLWEPQYAVFCSDCGHTYGSYRDNQQLSLYMIDSAGCPALDTVNFDVIFGYGLYIPNAFTPNGNDRNDVFLPKGYGIDEFEMLIFNRDGELIFRTTDFSHGWDGTFNGKLVMNGVYSYRIICRSFKKHVKEYIGRVTVIR
jgi:gliding motility-associated-like protein